IFAYIQIGIDTFAVTIIIFVTGSFASIFSFLYLVVIIYSSMLLFRKGSVVMAVLCSIQYGLLIDLEYYGIINPFSMDGGNAIVNYAWSQVLFKIVITMAACFAVAFLSGFLSEQLRRTRNKLSTLEDRIKRVEKMAYTGEMAAGITQKKKNPLASLSGSIQILRKEVPYNPEHDKLMQIILRETDRLNALVNNFLLFAKPPAGNIKKIELESALKEIVKLFEKDKAGNSKVSITSEFSSNIWIEMDPVHLRQVTWNLLLNAAEAIEGEGLVGIKTYPLKHNYACIEISDNGCGITDGSMQSIFDPFFTTKSRGTGLGLSIVHSILEHYDTWLDVESEVDRGTKFSFKVERRDPPT
ncbi:MAG: two-component sensor histidine kinase, partial [Deltaproteobacteria bacterium]|nr:two-component sensor histidine kinase [Deltaproteobacteria bacterium]